MIINEPETTIIAKQAFITRQHPLLEDICNQYGRDPSNLCIKVFYGNPLYGTQILDDALWGDNHDPNDSDQVRLNTTLSIGSKIQNILWKHNLSARVYAIFEAEYKGQRVACQLTDFIDGEFYSDIHQVEALHNNEIAKIAKEYHFSEVKDILGLHDVLNGKIIDVQQYTFDTDIEERIKQIYFEKGRYGKVYYQAVPELGLNGGPRKSLDRINYMKLESIDFKDKVVWDIGCAGGFFCRYALKRGAKIVYGFDEKAPLEAAFHVGNYLGAFNIDYIEADLSKGIPKSIPVPDIVFFLSMNFHIPIPERIYEANTVIFEDNGRETRNLTTLREPWTNHFKNIEFVGTGLDHGNKSCYILRK